MVQPQENFNQTMMSQIDNWQVEMQNVSEQPANQMIQRAKENIDKVTNFQLEVQEQLVDIKERIDTVRQKVRECIGNQDNFNGFLVGQVDDYLSDYDAQCKMMNERLEKDKQYWYQQQEEISAKKAEFEALMMRQLKFYQDKCSKQFFAAAPKLLDLSKCPLVDLPRFGFERKGNFDFRWPSLNDLKALNLENAPKLLGIKTSGEPNQALCSIQLFFKGGLKSPLIDSGREDGRDYRIVCKYSVISDEIVSSIKARVFELDRYGDRVYICNLNLQYQNGLGQSLTNYKDEGGQWKISNIPPNHVIVGVYGQYKFDGNFKRITNIGFIAMNLSALNQ